jgi:hypothetical protein
MTRPVIIHTANILTSRLSDALDVLGGRFVINPRAGCDQRTGYAVTAYPDRDVLIRGSVTPADISEYVFGNSDLLTRSGAVFGGWRCPWSGLAQLTVSAVRMDLADAVLLARQLGEPTVWDLFHDVPVKTSTRW